jgi:hypothetical protein
MGRLQTGDRLLPFSSFGEQICSCRAGVGVEADMPLYCQPRIEMRPWAQYVPAAKRRQNAAPARKLWVATLEE